MQKFCHQNFWWLTPFCYLISASWHRQLRWQMALSLLVLKLGKKAHLLHDEPHLLRCSWNCCCGVERFAMGCVIDNCNGFSLVQTCPLWKIFAESTINFYELHVQPVANSVTGGRGKALVNWICPKSSVRKRWTKIERKESLSSKTKSISNWIGLGRTFKNWFNGDSWPLLNRMTQTYIIPSSCRIWDQNKIN